MSSDPYNPAIINSSTIQIGYRRVNLEDTGCISDAAQLTSYWSTLDRRNFPLNQIARSLAAIDWQSYVKTRVLNVLPLTIHVIRMVDAINSCKSIRGAEGRINKVEEKLSVVVKNVNTTDYHKYIEDLLATVISGTDEFRIAYSLETLNHSFEFTNVKATFPDFRIGTSTIRLVEAKSRLNRTYTGDFRLTRERFSKIEEILPLISRDAYTVFERAFDLQKSHIALVNLNHSEFGSMFSGYSRVDNNNYDLKEAWQKCIELSAVGKEAVILYSERFGSVTGIAAFASTRRIVEDCGRKFDKEIKCLEKDGTRVDYHTIIELAKKFRF